MFGFHNINKIHTYTHTPTSICTHSHKSIQAHAHTYKHTHMRIRCLYRYCVSSIRMCCRCYAYNVCVSRRLLQKKNHG